MKRLEGIEVSRGIAALLIVLLHTTTILETPKYGGHAPFGRLFGSGAFGVDFFFVLSGFIIFYVHRRDLGHPERLRDYAIKRAIRIYPPYWAALLVVCPLFFLVPSLGDGTERDPVRMLASWLLAPHPAPPVLPVAWSLRHEVLFYVVFAVLLVRPRVGATLMVLWQAAIAGTALTGGARSFPANLFLDLRNLDFALGLGAAVLVRRGTLRAPGWWALAGSGTLAYLAVQFDRGRLPYGPEVHTLVCGILSTLVVAGLGTSDLKGAVRYPSLLRLLGAASYSVYLIHLPALSGIAKLSSALGLPGRLPAELLFPVFAVFATGVGVALHLGVEKPVTGWLRRRWLPSAAPEGPRAPGPAREGNRHGGG